MPLVTIAGQLGSGARPIGRMVAQVLGVECLDRELLVAAAKRIGTTVEAVAERDENPITLGERIGRIVGNFLERQAAMGMEGDVFLESATIVTLLSRSYGEAAAFPTARAEELTDTRYMEVIRSIIWDLALDGNVVILGRGGQVILRDWPKVLHVRTVAPFPLRVQRTMVDEELDRRAAERRAREEDRHRAAFHKKFFQADVDDVSLYHMVLNTSKLSYEQGTQIIVEGARAMEQG